MNVLNADLVSPEAVSAAAPPLPFVGIRKAIVRFARWAGWLRALNADDKVLVEMFLSWKPAKISR